MSGLEMREVEGVMTQVGCDPRHMKQKDFIQLGHEKLPLLQIIRAKCIDCCGGARGEVTHCPALKCINWPYRMGTNPMRDPREMTEERRAELVARGKRLGASRAQKHVEA